LSGISPAGDSRVDYAAGEGERRVVRVGEPLARGGEQALQLTGRRRLAPDQLRTLETPLGLAEQQAQPALLHGRQRHVGQRGRRGGR
jgi:hypothetical protein